MNLFVWISLYLLVGALVGGLLMRSSAPLTRTEETLMILVATFWPLELGLHLLAVVFRWGQWIGRRWPGR